MFFLLRSIFWLGLVFSLMQWGPEGGVAELGAPIALKTMANASGAIERACLSDPATCLEIVAKIQAIPSMERKPSKVAVETPKPAKVPESNPKSPVRTPSPKV